MSKMKPQSEFQYTADARDLGEDDVDLGEYLAVLAEYKWLIFAVALFISLLGVAYAFLARPSYAVDAMIQVEEDKSSQSLDSALGSMASLLASTVPVEGEMEILQSRMVQQKTIENLGLDLTAEPRYFPIFGRAYARYLAPDDPGVINPSPVGWDWTNGFAWGGERFQIGSIDVPVSYLNLKLRLWARENGHYELMDPDGNHLLDGEVGKPASAMVGHETLRIFVSELQARPGTGFNIIKEDMVSTLIDMSKVLTVAETVKQSSVIGMNYSAYDAKMAVRTVNEMANQYLRQNVERKSAEAATTLAYLNTQLPQLKQNMENAEARLNIYRTAQGSINITAETQAMLDQIVKVQGDAVLLKQHRDELVQRFTPSHPQVVAIDAQIKRLDGLQKDFDKRVKTLPDSQQEILRLQQDVDIATTLYTTLLNNAQQLDVARAGTVGNVRIIDYAIEPVQQDKPKQPLVIGVAVVLGIFLGVISAFVRHALRGGVEDPDVIEKHLGLPVYATVPHSKVQTKLSRRLHGNNGLNLVLATQDREDLSIESLRSLRTTLHFVLLEAKNNVLMLTGPSPNLGKSFVSVNLAAVLVAAGKRVLLIDADLRRGHLHEYVGLQRGAGLSDYVSGQVDLYQAIRPTMIDGLHLLSTGAVPPNPSELLLHERFATAVQDVAKRFDHVIIDSPPVLAVTDAAVIGRLAGASLMVVKAGTNPLREIEVAVKRLRQAGINLRGVIFNDVKKIGSRYGAGKYVYQYAYSKKR